MNLKKMEFKRQKKNYEKTFQSDDELSDSVIEMEIKFFPKKKNGLNYFHSDSIWKLFKTKDF